MNKKEKRGGAGRGQGPKKKLIKKKAIGSLYYEENIIEKHTKKTLRSVAKEAVDKYIENK